MFASIHESKYLRIFYTFTYVGDQFDEMLRKKSIFQSNPLGGNAKKTSPVDLENQGKDANFTLGNFLLFDEVQGVPSLVL